MRYTYLVTYAFTMNKWSAGIKVTESSGVGRSEVKTDLLIDSLDRVETIEKEITDVLLKKELYQDNVSVTLQNFILLKETKPGDD